MQHAEMPFMKVVEAVAPKRDASRTAIFQTMVDWKGEGWGQMGDSLNGMQEVSSNSLYHHGTASFDVQLILFDEMRRGEGLRGTRTDG